MRRRRVPELMDNPSLDSIEHQDALTALDRIHRMLGAYAGLYREAQRIAGKGNPSILDLGTGGGGFLAYAASRGNVPGQAVGNALIGLDRSMFALQRARRCHAPAPPVLVADARAIPLGDGSVDVVTALLFLHHFDEADAGSVLKEAARVARKGLVVCDLWRSRLALLATWIATRAVSRSWVFHVDGPRSVHAAFNTDELALLAERAGLGGARVTRHLPFRTLLTWKKAIG